MSARDPGRGWQASATQTLINHLKSCSLQTDDIRQAAEAHAAQKTSSPYHRPPVTFPQPQTGHHNMPDPFVSNPTALPLLQTGTLFTPPALYSPTISPIVLNTPVELPPPSPVPSPALSESVLPSIPHGDAFHVPHLVSFHARAVLHPKGPKLIGPRHTNNNLRLG